MTERSRLKSALLTTKEHSSAWKGAGVQASKQEDARTYRVARVEESDDVHPWGGGHEVHCACGVRMI